MKKIYAVAFSLGALVTLWVYIAIYFAKSTQAASAPAKARAAQLTEQSSRKIAWLAELSTRLTGTGPELKQEFNYVVLSTDGYMIVLQSREQFMKCKAGLSLTGPWRPAPAQLLKSIQP